MSIRFISTVATAMTLVAGVAWLNVGAQAPSAPKFKYDP